MPTSEERLTAVEQALAATRQFEEQAIRHLRELDASTTILLGVVRAQGQDIRRIFDRLDTMDGRLNWMTTRLDQIDGRLDGIDARLAEHTTLLSQHTELLKQILARLPGPSQP